MGSTKTLFDDIRAEFLLGQLRYLALEGIAEWVSEAGLLEVDNVLENVIAIRVLNKMEGAVSDLADKLGFLVTGGVVYATLQHTAAMTMGSDRYAVGANSIENELRLINSGLLGHK